MTSSLVVDTGAKNVVMIWQKKLFNTFGYKNNRFYVKKKQNRKLLRAGELALAYGTAVGSLRHAEMKKTTRTDWHPGTQNKEKCNQTPANTHKHRLREKQDLTRNCAGKEFKKNPHTSVKTRYKRFK